MLDAHLFLVILVTIVLVIFSEFQKLRNISWILTISCIAYVFLSISSDLAELANNRINIIDKNIVNDLENNNLNDNLIAELETKLDITEIENVTEINGQYAENISDEKVEIKIDTTIENPLKVNTIAISKAIHDREPIESGTLFISDINELFCHTGIDNPTENNIIVHTWQFNSIDYLKSYLRVGNSSNWRCWSRITIKPELVGDWSVSVSDSTGNILKSIEFTIIPSEN